MFGSSVELDYSVWRKFKEHVLNGSVEKRISTIQTVLGLINQLVCPLGTSWSSQISFFSTRYLLNRQFWIHTVSGISNHTTAIQDQGAKSWFMLENSDKSVARNFLLALRNTTMRFHSPRFLPGARFWWIPKHSKQKWQNSLKRKQYLISDTTAILVDAGNHVWFEFFINIIIISKLNDLTPFKSIRRFRYHQKNFYTIRQAAYKKREISQNAESQKCDRQNCKENARCPGPNSTPKKM